MYKAGDPTHSVWTVWRCLISVPGIHIFGSLGEAAKNPTTPTGRLSQSSAASDTRVRQAIWRSVPHPNTPPNGAHLRKQNASDTALCFLRIAHPLIETARHINTGINSRFLHADLQSDLRNDYAQEDRGSLRRVLIVDDDRELGELLGEYLLNEGLSLEFAEEGTPG